MWRLGCISWRLRLLETRRPISSARRRKWLLLRVLLPVLVLLSRKPEINPPTSIESARMRALGGCTNFSFVAWSRSDRSLRSSSCSACPLQNGVNLRCRVGVSMPHLAFCCLGFVHLRLFPRFSASAARATILKFLELHTDAIERGTVGNDSVEGVRCRP